MLDNSVHEKLLKANFQLIALGVGSLLVALLTTWTLSERTHQLADKHALIAHHSTQLLAATRQAMESLRAWVSEPSANFKQRRDSTWRNEIWPSVENLENIAVRWNDQDVQNSLKLVKSRLFDLQESQWWVEDIAQTPGNEPARVEFDMRGELIATNIHLALEAIKRIEEDTGFNESFPVDAQYDLQSEFTHAHLLLARFVDQGNPQYERSFRLALGKFSSALDFSRDLDSKVHEHLLEVFRRIHHEFTAYIPLVEKIIRLRKSPQWNHADFLMQSETSVISGELKDLIETLSEQQNKYMLTDADEVIKLGRNSTVLMVVLIVAMFGIATLVARRNAFRITQPIGTLYEAVTNFSREGFYEDIAVTSDDEFAHLAQGFNKMRKTVHNQERILKTANTNLERLVTERTSDLVLARELAETTLRSIGDGVVTSNEAGRIQSMNPVAETLMGSKLIEIRDKLIWDHFKIVNVLDQKSVECPAKRCLQEKDTVHLENNSTLITRNGIVIPIISSAAPILGKNGTLLGSILVFKDVTEERRLSTELSYQASHDDLTDLINRREFELRIASALQFAHNENLEHALAFLDIDQFKIINDTCGRAAGDSLLREIAMILKKELRASDVLARLSGDEFAMLLDTCPLDRATDVCERMRHSIQSFHFFYEEKKFNVTISIGLTSIHSESQTVKDILTNADTACYMAKDKGRNCIHVNHPQDTEVVTRKSEMQWLPRIREALEHDHFVLYAQPIVPIKNAGGLRPHYEILTRMLGEQGEIIPPGAFIPPAERYNLIMPLDKWVVRHSFLACQQGTLANALEAGVGISINLSGPSLGNREMADFILEQMEACNIPGSLISFEITETSAISNLANATSFIMGLQQFGFRFGLDDFGTGLSSFSYLRDLPVNYVKIDGSFVREIDKNPIDAAVVSSIHSIAKLMGKETVAVFVENEAILRKLDEIGVDFAQGWAIGKPIPLENLNEHLKVLDSKAIEVV